MRYLQFALRNNELVSINDVPSGLECGCVCPECGAILVAKKGSRRMHHFSHYQASECEKGIETALHLLGKQIIEKTKRLFVPAIPTVEKSIEKITEYDEAIEEKKIDGSIKPDVQLRARMDLWGAGLVVNVEIKVSHAVDEAKKYKLLELGIPTVEIDLSDVETDYTEETIEQLILSGEKTKWVYSPRAKQYFITEWLCDIRESKLRRFKHYWVDYCPLNGLATIYGRWWSELPCYSCGCSDAPKPKKFINCMGKLKGIDINGIERIERVERDRGFLKSVDLIVNGERIHRDFDIPPKKENDIIYD
ncbi:MAG: competence protein CoiA [Roseburia sp.]|nr:competence protein CoiA [Roseburia sp.]